MKGGKVFCGPLAFFFLLFVYFLYIVQHFYVLLLFFKKKGIIDMNNLSFGSSRLE